MYGNTDTGIGSGKEAATATENSVVPISSILIHFHLHIVSLIFIVTNYSLFLLVNTE